MKKVNLCTTLALLTVFILGACGEIEEDFFWLRVTNYTDHELLLVENGQTFDRIKPSETKIPEDIFDYETLYRFAAVSIRDGSFKSEIFVTVTDREFFDWVIE